MVNFKWSLSFLAMLSLPVSGCVRALEQTSEYACEADSDCPSGSTCFAERGHTVGDGDGICGVKGLACVVSEDCISPALCRRPGLSGYGTRNALGTCELPPPGVECFVGEDCLTGEECVPQTGKCTDEERVCIDDSDCVKGQFCLSGYSDKSCHSIYCSADQECFPYRCGGDRKCGDDYCGSSSSCAPGAVCRTGKCEAK